MSLQKLHYENISGTLVQREGLLSWRCPLCKAGGQSLEVMRTCPECGSKEATLPVAQPAPSVPDVWLRAIDEALIVAHIGVANAHDTYEQAKAMLDNLLRFHVDMAIDPAVNGGYKLVPIEPTDEMLRAIRAQRSGARKGRGDRADWKAWLAAAPEAKS